jgi:hypothetical protein
MILSQVSQVSQGVVIVQIILTLILMPLKKRFFDMTKSRIDQIANGMTKREIVDIYNLLTHSYSFEVIESNQLKVVGLDNEHLVDDLMCAIITRFKREFIALTQQKTAEANICQKKH